MLSEGMLFHNHYELRKKLGRGGFSEVWLAFDRKTEHDVAIKVYAPGNALDDEGVQIFKKEFAIVYDLNHTNLLRPSHYDDWNNVPYLVMPFYKQGSTYKKYIQNGQQITETECWQLLHDVAAGLAYLHAQNPPIVHRDIKPDNIMCSDDGRYLITDFGISTSIRKTMRNTKDESSDTLTIAYTAPECFSANPKPIMFSDIWALGATMFEIMTSEPPFGDRLGGSKQKNGADIPLLEGPYSDELKELVYACLALTPYKRPHAKDLERITYEHLMAMQEKDISKTEPIWRSNPTPKKDNDVPKDEQPNVGLDISTTDPAEQSATDQQTIGATVRVDNQQSFVATEPTTHQQYLAGTVVGDTPANGPATVPHSSDNSTEQHQAPISSGSTNDNSFPQSSTLQSTSLPLPWTQIIIASAAGLVTGVLAYVIYAIL